MQDEVGDPWFQNLFAERIGGACYGKSDKIYKFEKIKRAKRAVKLVYPDRQLLDFGIGENDDMAPAVIRDVMHREIDRLENRGYADNGIQEFREAAARFMERNFAVKLNPSTEINHVIGSKPAFAMLPAVFINPGDVTLLTVPGYPVAGTHTTYYGGIVHRLPLLAENHFFPDLDSIASKVLEKAKLLVLNYPNSPTGKIATRDFYSRVVDFARKNRIVVIQDAAHICLTYAGDPLSFLEVDGAREVGVEVHSLSKGFNMIGWRIGFVAGHPKLVQAFADVKDNSDSGQFMAIQRAAAVALDTPEIPRNVPPAFVTCPGSGDRGHAIWALEYYEAMLRAGVPNVEMHLYGHGRHPGEALPDGSRMSAGLADRNGIPFGKWQDRFIEWFRDCGFLQKSGLETRAARESAAFAQPTSK